MPLELSYLSAATALLAIHLMAEVVAGNVQHSFRELLGPRDNLPPHNAVLGRTKRATQNMVEALVMFATVTLIAQATGRLNNMTELGAGLFLGGRILYAPLYWFGVPVLRTLAWFIAMIGTTIVFFQVLPFMGA